MSVVILVLLVVQLIGVGYLTYISKREIPIPTFVVKESEGTKAYIKQLTKLIEDLSKEIGVTKTEYERQLDEIKKFVSRKGITIEEIGELLKPLAPTAVELPSREGVDINLPVVESLSDSREEGCLMAKIYKDGRLHHVTPIGSADYVEAMSDENDLRVEVS